MWPAWVWWLSVDGSHKGCRYKFNLWVAAMAEAVKMHP
ncbi:hypothetical protein EDC26_11740 [Paralcaligenes ureilyticus]|uniref:Uncharacterized protein n=1 Tax=Paralcaligenes ureilyticus TaxID=627131 RepID=A0A4R3LVV9_9BURK|nr:hypothetical protein EDC26_11740 [Paralcaligenes ureilyticus]